MENRFFCDKFGRSQVLDAATGLSFHLPSSLSIFARTNRYWAGGSRDGRYYLLIKRTATADPLPIQIAERDIDLLLHATSPARVLTPVVEGLPVAGSLASRWVRGYLTRYRYSEELSYVVLLVDTRGGDGALAAGMALGVVSQLIAEREVEG